MSNALQLYSVTKLKDVINFRLDQNLGRGLKSIVEGRI